MSRRRAGTAPFSLLSFQDAIMGVTGVILLIVLLLVLQLITSPPGEFEPAAGRIDPVAEANARLAQFRESIATTEADLRQLQDESARIRAMLADAATRDDLKLPSPEEMASLGDDALADLSKAAQEEAARAAALNTSAAQTDAEIRAARVRAQQLKDEADRIVQAARAGPPTFAVAAGNEHRRPILLHLTGQEIVLATVEEGKLNVLQRRIVANARSVPAIVGDLVSDLRRQQDTVVILVSPDGVPHFDATLEAVREHGLSVGWDVAPPAL